MVDIIKKSDGELISLHQIAEIEFISRELSDCQITIKDWLKELLCNVWSEQEDFSSNRAFGNSDWSYDIYEVLYDNNIINGSMDEFDELHLTIEELELADKIILDIIVNEM